MGKVNNFFELTRGIMSVLRDQAKFVNLLRYAPEVVADHRARTAKFIGGLRHQLREALTLMLLIDFVAAATTASNTEIVISRNQRRHKELENRDRRIQPEPVYVLAEPCSLLCFGFIAARSSAEFLL